MKKIIILYFLISLTNSCKSDKIDLVNSSNIKDSYDCSTDEVWTNEKSKWCCEHKSECSQECRDSSVCTADYSPALCSLENESAEGSNICQAKKKLRRTLCENNIRDIDKSKIKCALIDNKDMYDCTTKEMWTNEKSKWCCEHKSECSQDCTDSTVCTAVYSPAFCSLENESAKGSNMCEAKKKLRRTLCEKNIRDVDESKIKCALIDDFVYDCTTKEMWTDEKSKWCCEHEGKCSQECRDSSVCTADYSPAVCSLENKSAKGSNICEAKKKLRITLCEKNIRDVDESKIKCALIDDFVYDCTTKEMWTDEKSKWCCKHEGKCSQECRDSSVCTADYSPALCSLENESAEGSNICQAKKKLRRTLCENNIRDVDESKIKCSLLLKVD